MNTLSLYRRCCAFLLCTGFGLALLALLLHPMNPDDFLWLALTAPPASLAGAYGLEAATMFWIGAALTGAGVVGMLFPPRALVCMRDPAHTGAGFNGYATADGEDAARLWSFR